MADKKSSIASTTKRVKDMIRKAIEEGGLDQINEIHRTIHDTGAIDYTAKCAENESKLAIEAVQNLADSPYKDALVFLAQFAVNRSH